MFKTNLVHNLKCSYLGTVCVFVNCFKGVVHDGNFIFVLISIVLMSFLSLPGSHKAKMPMHYAEILKGSKNDFLR